MRAALVLALLAVACVDPPPRLEDAKAPAATPTPLTVVEITPPTASDSRPLAIAAQMEKWARSYVALLAPVGVAVRSIDSGDSSRETCNAFLTAVYNAQNQLPAAADPDIEKSVKMGFENAVTAGGSCIRGEGGARDVGLVLAGSAFHLADLLASERYGLSIKVPGISDLIGGEAQSAIERNAIAAAKSSAPGAPSAPASAVEGPLIVTAAGSKITEANNVYYRYAWRVRVRNPTTQPQSFGIIVEFQEAEGFTVDTDRAYGLAIGAGQELEYTGDTLVSLPAAATIKGAVVKLTG